MERSKTENRSAFAQATKRRDGAMHEMFGLGSDPVGQAESNKHHKLQVGIWRIAGNRSRPHAGWTDAVAISARPRQTVPWLSWLASIAKRNRLLSLSLWSGRK